MTKYVKDKETGTYKRKCFHKKKKMVQMDHKTYHYWDIETRSKATIMIDELQKMSCELPTKCQNILEEINITKRNLRSDEQSALMKLCSLSIGCWNGSPKGKLAYITMADYQAEFYIQMVKFLTSHGKSRFDPSRAKWPAFVKWIRLSTMSTIARTWQQAQVIMDTANHSYCKTMDCEQNRVFEDIEESKFTYDTQMSNTQDEIDETKM